MSSAAPFAAGRIKYAAAERRAEINAIRAKIDADNAERRKHMGWLSRLLFTGSETKSQYAWWTLERIDQLERMANATTGRDVILSTEDFHLLTTPITA